MTIQQTAIKRTLVQLQGMKQKLDQTRLILFIHKDKVDPNNSTHR